MFFEPLVVFLEFALFVAGCSFADPAVLVYYSVSRPVNLVDLVAVVLGLAYLLLDLLGNHQVVREQELIDLKH